jgi:CRP-like cAMP-binding protein
MFFIASGTVCVTTNNGKELCHLVDGDYFGETALILKNNKAINFVYFDKLHNQLKFDFFALQRIASVTAIEFCEIYILDYSSFKKYVEINETIMQKLTETAELRMKLTLKAEEEHKKQLNERIARESFVH